jgi:hypothetical protein
MVDFYPTRDKSISTFLTLGPKPIVICESMLTSYILNTGFDKLVG